MRLSFPITVQVLQYTDKNPFQYNHASDFSWCLSQNPEGNISFLDLTVLSPFLLLFPFKISTTLQPQDKIIAPSHTHTHMHIYNVSIYRGFFYSNSFNVLCAQQGSQSSNLTSSHYLLSSIALNTLGSYASSQPSKLHPLLQTLNPSIPSSP